MELRQLAEVDLREAIGPINRAVTGHYLPAVRTVSSVRERAQLGVLDLKLSRCARSTRCARRVQRLVAQPQTRRIRPGPGRRDALARHLRPRGAGD